MMTKQKKVQISYKHTDSHYKEISYKLSFKLDKLEDDSSLDFKKEKSIPGCLNHGGSLVSHCPKIIQIDHLP